MATFGISMITARPLRAVCIWAAFLSCGVFAHAAGPDAAILGTAMPASAPAVGQPAPQTAAGAMNRAGTKIGNGHPLWSELTPAQQQALAPLAPEWDKLESIRRKKWIEIGDRYAKMKPEEQQRLQEKMRAWVKMTPDQRRVARENFARVNKLPPEQKAAKWQEYQQLSDEQKKQLAAEAAAKKKVATLPSPQNKNKPVAPIKSTPKPVLEQSVTPQATNQAMIQPSIPPNGSPASAPANASTDK